VYLNIRRNNIEGFFLKLGLLICVYGRKTGRERKLLGLYQYCFTSIYSFVYYFISN